METNSNQSSNDGAKTAEKMLNDTTKELMLPPAFIKIYLTLFQPEITRGIIVLTFQRFFLITI